jgi:uncharacterized protein (DUF1015 family)
MKMLSRLLNKSAMATIQPFQPIRPNPHYADQLVFTKPQAESVSGDYTREGGLKPLKTLLETGARLRPETPGGQELAYKDIRETLQNLLEGAQLWKEKTKGLFVYEVVHQTYRQTGIWALTDLADYTSGRIKIHELTFADSVRRMKNYRENTGLEGSPVLLTYPPDGTINTIIALTQTGPPQACLGNEHGLHRLWKIKDRDLLQKLTAAFARIGTTYLADGHHRLESAEELAREQKEKRLKTYDSISSLYMATDQLRILEYDRVVVPDGPVATDRFFRELAKNFTRQGCSKQPVQPAEQHQLGMCFKGGWYALRAKPHTYQGKNIADALDAALLQEYILAPVFGITDPKTDSRLKCAGGEKALEEIDSLFQEHPQAIAFTLCPLTASQLITVADAGHILPPKSTWIVPKVPYGLLIHRH